LDSLPSRDTEREHLIGLNRKLNIVEVTGMVDDNPVTVV
jgi:hypothetical protein